MQYGYLQCEAHQTLTATWSELDENDNIAITCPPNHCAVDYWELTQTAVIVTDCFGEFYTCYDYLHATYSEVLDCTAGSTIQCGYVELTCTEKAIMPGEESDGTNSNVPHSIDGRNNNAPNTNTEDAHGSGGGGIAPGSEVGSGETRFGPPDAIPDPDSEDTPWGQEDTPFGPDIEGEGGPQSVDNEGSTQSVEITTSTGPSDIASTDTSNENEGIEPLTSIMESTNHPDESAESTQLITTSSGVHTNHPSENTITSSNSTETPTHTERPHLPMPPGPANTLLPWGPDGHLPSWPPPPGGRFPTIPFLPNGNIPNIPFPLPNGGNLPWHPPEPAPNGGNLPWNLPPNVVPPGDHNIPYSGNRDHMHPIPPPFLPGVDSGDGSSVAQEIDNIFHTGEDTGHTPSSDNHDGGIDYDTGAHDEHQHIHGKAHISVLGDDSSRNDHRIAYLLSITVANCLLFCMVVIGYSLLDGHWKRREAAFGDYRVRFGDVKEFDL